VSGRLSVLANHAYNDNIYNDHVDRRNTWTLYVNHYRGNIVDYHDNTLYTDVRE
jgi:hypothetical protein